MRHLKKIFTLFEKPSLVKLEPHTHFYTNYLDEHLQLLPG